MGSIEVAVETEKPEDGSVAGASSCIARPPTYSTVAIQTGKSEDGQHIAESKQTIAPKTM